MRRADNEHRRLRPSILCDNRLPVIREKDDAGATQNGQYGAEGRGCGDSCLDAKMLYAGAVGEAEGKYCCAREGYDGREG